MVVRPVHLSQYEFTVVSALRAKQLLAGCTPRLPGDHNAMTMAQMEAAAGIIARTESGDAPASRSPRTADSANNSDR
jgi:DNA-directed RNA polymerase subunit K/omega